MNLLGKIVVVFALVVALPLAYFVRKSVIKGNAEYAEFFYHKELDGKITYITTGTGGVVLMTLNDSTYKTYSLLPRRDDGIDFAKIAKIGDRFIKHADQDTVQLIHNFQVFKFVINRPELKKS